MAFRLFSLLVIATPIAVKAQPLNYNFAGISWNQSVDKVHDQLIAAGYTGCELRRRLECRLAKSCSCGFDGPNLMNANATFEDNKLIYITMAIVEPVKITATLIAKYGKPLRESTSSRRDSIMDLVKQVSDTKLTWNSVSGDKIVLDGQLLDYYSGIYLKAKELQKNGGLSKF